MISSSPGDAGGAGILPNNQGTMAGWITDSQGIKSGNRWRGHI
jgi:hypothetical protein